MFVVWKDFVQFHSKTKMIHPFPIILFVVFFLFGRCGAGIPADQHFFEQPVDHIEDSNSDFLNRTWQQRYYIRDDHFRGPGSPIFVILGGEGAIEPATGLMYPFVAETLAKAFGAFVLEPEHRFYGLSQPISAQEIAQVRAMGLPDPRVQLLTSEQALLDAMNMIQIWRGILGCSTDRFSEYYCPVLTVGGSYPGFLSAFSRIAYPHIVDMAYAASAPMKFYAQQVDQYAYYDHISKVAETAHSGCIAAVRNTLENATTIITTNQELNVSTAAAILGICPGTLPEYIDSISTLLEEVFMMIAYTFANDNMAYYPPSNVTRLYRACMQFGDDTKCPIQRIRMFLVSSLASVADNTTDCFDMRLQLPVGPNATVSAGDWSGVGSGISGDSWDFQTCTLLVETIGFSGDRNSMFPKRYWSMEWMTRHCQARFGVTPTPLAMNEKWGLDDIVKTGASRILFTNGMNDGWSVSGVTINLTDTLLAINFPNGAHHSDLFHRAPSEEDTDDLNRGFKQIQGIISKWLADLPGGSHSRNGRKLGS